MEESTTIGKPVESRLKAMLSKPVARPMVATIVAEGGMGKTTLASMFPRPVFIRTEDGTQSIAHRQDVFLFEKAQCYQDIVDQLMMLANEPHKLKTVVIDSITQANVMFEAEVVRGDPKARSINQALGGYGAGHSAVASMHMEIRRLCEILNTSKGMNVVYLAHADSETVDMPDMDAYTRYTIRMNKKSISHYSDNVDLVGFIKLKTFVTGKDGEKKKATSTGQRIITCYPVASHISKNRYGISEDLEFDQDNNPFAAYLPKEE